MKNFIKTLTILLIFCFAPVCNAQFRPLLGYSDIPYPIKTTPLGIRYNAQGFDLWRKKWVLTKTPNWLVNQNASHLLEPFDIEARALCESESNMPQIIDNSWLYIRSLWLNCGGVYAQIANNTSPSSILIIVEDSPFWMPQWGIYASGTTDGTTIRVCSMSSSGLFSNPSTASLVTFESLVKWECGNLLMLRGNLWDGTIQGEFGSRSPCGLN